MYLRDVLVRAVAVFLAICAILAVSCILPVFQELSTYEKPELAFESSIKDFNVDRGMYVSCQSTEPGCLQKENHILRQKVYSLRKQLGRLSCASDGMGPTGGICLDADGRHAGRDIGLFDLDLARSLAAFFRQKSVLDLGCGLGDYGRVFKEEGIAWEGYDGAENIEEITDHFVRWADLTVPQWFGRRHDWVMSLQVGDAIPAKYEGAFLDNVIRHARHGIILTWAARPATENDRAGHGNAKSPEGVIAVMAHRGFVHDNTLAAQLAAGAALEGTPLMVFWNKNAVQHS